MVYRCCFRQASKFIHAFFSRLFTGGGSGLMGTEDCKRSKPVASLFVRAADVFEVVEALVPPCWAGPFW